MKSLSSCLLAAASTFFTVNVFAAGQVSYLNIDGDNVHFATSEAKVASSPECAVDETKERFAVSLKTEEGRAMYSLLITAMSKNIEVSVTSALDCGDAFGLERAQSVSIAPQVTEADTSNPAFKGTILEHSFRVQSDHFWQDSALTSTTFLSDSFNFRRGASKRIYTTNRTNIGSATGSGWLTAILTNVTNASSVTKLEVDIDGEFHTFDLTSSRAGRYFFGVAEGSSTYQGEQIAGPLTVVSQGKGIRFERYARVYVQYDALSPGSDSQAYSGINFVYDN